MRENFPNCQLGGHTTEIIREEFPDYLDGSGKLRVER